MGVRCMDMDIEHRLRRMDMGIEHRLHCLDMGIKHRLRRMDMGSIENLQGIYMGRERPHLLGALIELFSVPSGVERNFSPENILFYFIYKREDYNHAGRTTSIHIDFHAFFILNCCYEERN